MKAALPANQLARVLTNAALFKGDQMRPILEQCRVTFEKDRLELATTDSYALLFEHVDAEVPAEMIGAVGKITLTEIKELLAVSKGSASMATLELNDDSQSNVVTVIECSNGATFKFTDFGSFPNLAYLIDPLKFDGLMGPQLGIGLWQLARLAKIVARDGSVKDAKFPAKLEVIDNLKPMLFRLGSDIAVYVMPVKIP